MLPACWIVPIDFWECSYLATGLAPKEAQVAEERPRPARLILEIQSDEHWTWICEERNIATLQSSDSAS